ncbi:collagen alpha-1(II) chain-like [Sapajus apella]|uniref:Collagen alpha-1(II) chain-like n=1 Tax=Sapajus apella TaxID=9515 RepID=A0A6J3F437_SAPAP|nr:collagen alpha-1(II) chain-like [Sapajus apella]
MEYVTTPSVAQPKHTRAERRDSPEHRAVGAARAAPAAAAVGTGGHVAAPLIGAVAAVAGGAAAAVGARGARQPPGIRAAATSCWAGGLAAPQALRGPVGHRAVVPASQRAQRPPPPVGLGLGLVLPVGLGRLLVGRRRLLGRLSPAAVDLRVPVLAAATAAGRGRGAFPAATAAAAAAALGGLGPFLAAVAVAAAGLRGLAAAALPIPPPVLAVALLASTAAAAAVPAGKRRRPRRRRLRRRPCREQPGRAEAAGAAAVAGAAAAGAATAVAAAEGTGIASACGVPPTSSPPSSDPRLPPAPCPSCSASPRARRRARRGCGLLPGQTLAISPAGNGSGGGGTPSTRAGRETRHDNPGRDSSPWIPGHSGVRSGLRASGKQESRRRSSRSRSSSYSRQRKHQMRRALTCWAVPSPPSAPGGGGAASAALSARAAQRGSTTFVSASLHRALTLGASSGEGSGRDNSTPPPPPPRRRRRPPVVAATHRRRLASGLGLTTTPSLGPRALCGPRGWAAGRGEAGATRLRLTVGAASVRGWAGGYFRGDGGGGVSESVAVGTGPDFLLPSPPPSRAEVAELPLSSVPPLHEEALGVRGRPLLAPPLPSSLLVSRRESNGTSWLGPNLHNPSFSPSWFGFSLQPRRTTGSAHARHAQRKPKMSGGEAREAGTKLPRSGVLAPARDRPAAPEVACCSSRSTSGEGGTRYEEGLKKGEVSCTAHCCCLRLSPWRRASRACCLRPARSAVLALCRRRTACLLSERSQ